MITVGPSPLKSPVAPSCLAMLDIMLTMPCMYREMVLQLLDEHADHDPVQGGLLAHGDFYITSSTQVIFIHPLLLSSQRSDCVVP